MDKTQAKSDAVRTADKEGIKAERKADKGRCWQKLRPTEKPTKRKVGSNKSQRKSDGQNARRAKKRHQRNIV
jgi:hypothetical protein